MGALRKIFGIDPRTLALFRVSLALVILFDLLLRAGNLSDFYTDQGVLPRAQWLNTVHEWHFSIHALSGLWAFQALLFVISGLAALALLVGYRSKLASILSFLMLASLLNRNTIILQGGDELLVSLCFWSMFLPLGRTWSFDAAMDRTHQSDPNAPRKLEVIFSAGSVALIVQVLITYIFTVLLKSGDVWRRDFDSAFYALSLQQFATPLGTWLSQFPDLLKPASFFSLVTEVFAPFLILVPAFWPRLRYIGLVMLLSMHAGFLLLMHLGLFPLIDFVAISALVPKHFWRALRRAETSGEGPVVLYYDEDCGFCLRCVLILREFFCPRGTRIETCQSDSEARSAMERENTWMAREPGGVSHTRFEAIAYVVGLVGIFRPVAWLMRRPFALRLGTKLYIDVANNRSKLSGLARRWLPYREKRDGGSLVSSAVVAFMLVVLAAINVTGYPGLEHHRSQWMSIPTRLARIDQRWDMFSPNPMGVSVFPQIVGTLRNDKVVNLYERTEMEADWDPPPSFYGLYDGYRWRKFMERVYVAPHNKARFGLSAYECRVWNRSQPIKARQLATVDIYFVELHTNTNGLPKVRKRLKVWHHWCFPEYAQEK